MSGKLMKASAWAKREFEVGYIHPNVGVLSPLFLHVSMS